nr:hypothetical protein [Tanacetum cinerariifolium]
MKLQIGKLCYAGVATLDKQLTLDAFTDVDKGKLSGSPRRWLTKDMVQSIIAGNEVLNPMPLSEFNPSVGHVVKSAIDKALSSDVVKDTTFDVVKENPKDKTEILK